jgi:hypothetical protein
LSNNEIIVIENLEPLVSLEELNLAGNRIERIENLANLPNLISLNLSKNRIQKLTCSQPLFNLQVLDLSANQLDDLPDTLSALRSSFPSLEGLNLSGNPMTTRFGPAYRTSVCKALPRLRYLDGFSVSTNASFQVQHSLPQSFPQSRNLKGAPDTSLNSSTENFAEQPAAQTAMHGEDGEGDVSERLSDLNESVNDMLNAHVPSSRLEPGNVNFPHSAASHEDLGDDNLDESALPEEVRN